MSDVRTGDLVELGLFHVWGAALRYGDLVGRTPRQRASLSVSALPRLTGAALAGLLLRSGPVAASVGSDRQFNVILLVQCLLSAAVAVVGGTALSLVPSLLPLFYAFLCVLVVVFIVFVLPSRKVGRERGFMVSNMTWKKRHAVRRFWGINALVHDPGTPAAEIAVAIQRLIPDVGPDWAIVVCVANEEQAHAVELLGFNREEEAPGILYRIADSGAAGGVVGMTYPQPQQGQASTFPPAVGPSLSAPLYTAGPAQALGRFFKKYAVFHGRASRAEYWWVAMACAIVSFVLEALPFVLSGASPEATGPSFAVVGCIFLALFFGTIVPNLSLTARRLHDANLSGWLMLLYLVPLLGEIAMLAFLLLPPNPAGQRYDRPTARLQPGW